MAIVLLLILSSFAGMLPTPGPADVDQASALSNPLYWPVSSGSSWTIGQGYNTKTTEGGSHWACNAQTLKDGPTGTLACRAHYQYQFALDLARSDGNTVGQAALAPADGTITWTEAATGGGVIDLGDGYAFGFFHLRLDPAIVPGARVVRGQRLGTVAPAGEANSGSWPHLHVNLWQSSDGGNWDRKGVPFAGAYALGGVSMPDKGASSINQYRGTSFVSANTQVGSDATTPTPVAPGTPVQVSPANGVAITQQNPTATMVWRTVTGANEYQVVLDDGRVASPWLTGTTWTTPTLTAGQHVWQVRSRNYAGQSVLSVKWLLFVNTSGVPSGGASPSASASASLGTPSAGLTALPTGGAATTSIALRGGGFSASETVRITLDTANGPLLSTTTAAGNGSINSGITIGNATRGVHTLIARGQTSGRQQTTTFTVAPSVARAPINGTPGTVVTVTARGYAANETVRLTWQTATGPVLAELKTASNGTGTAAFPLPDTARGWHDYSGLGLSSGARAWGNFGIDSGLSMSTESASPGQAITAVARGFAAGQPVTFTWNKSPASAGTTLCIITTNSTGRATCPITVPAGSGVFPVTAASSDGTSVAVSVRVGGGLSVSVSPASGAVGASVQVSAGGFSANEAVDLRWDSSTTFTRVTANGSGTVSRLMTVPFLSNGSHTLNLVGQVSGRRTSTTFSVSQSMSVNPTSGASGSSVSLSAQGMPGGVAATAYWNRTSGSGGTALCSGTVTASGTFACSFTVPTATANTTYPVTVIAGSVSANATYRVSGTGAGGPVGPPSAGNGTFVVNTTREGLVGGTTSSGHVIQTLDRFVSLPACTASSCPWLAPGVPHPLWGVRTECGSSCYVRIINPANNRCIVAPIKDTGPWYTQDDWWNPTSSRFLNTLSSNPNILRQGYPGAQAARDGLDTGYGIAPSGIGISNKGYEVGNSSAIDIGDGSWVDLGFSIAGASAGGLIVTMLWQSGESPNAAAQACGQSSANPPPGAGGGTGTPQPGVTPTATPRPGTATPRPATATPRPVTATPRPATQAPRTPTPTPRATRVPQGGTATPRPGTATPRPATATPRPATATPRPATQTPRTPTPTVRATRPPRGSTGSASLSVATESVQAGQLVRLSGTGYVPNETVTIRAESASGPIIGRVLAQASGGFTVSVLTTDLAGGDQLLVAHGDRSARSASDWVSIMATVRLDPGSGPTGGVVQVQLGGFVPFERVQLRWGSGTAAVVTTVQVDTLGDGRDAVRVPTTGGVQNLFATGLSSRQTASTAFTSFGAQLAVTANSATPGSVVSVSASGLPTGWQASVYWQNGSSGRVAVCRDAVSSAGTLACAFPLPASVTSGGPNTVTIVAGNVSIDASVSFTGGPSEPRPPRAASLSVPDGTAGADTVSTGELDPTATLAAGTAIAILFPEETATPEPALGTVTRTTTDGGVPASPTIEPQAPSVEIATSVPTDVVTPTTPVDREPTATMPVSTRPVSPPAAASPVDVGLTIPTVAPTPPVVLAPTLTLDPSIAATVPAEPTTEQTPDPGTIAPTETEAPPSEDGDAPEDLTTPTTAPEPPVAPQPTELPTFESTATTAPEPTATGEATSTATAASTAIPTEDPTATATATLEPTATPTEVPSATPTAEPTATPTTEPTATATLEPTATATLEPTATATLEPTATLAPEPITQVQTIYPIADTSIRSAYPDDRQSPDLSAGLQFGGPDGTVSYLTFDVSSVAAPGTVVSATLTLTGTGINGATGGELLAIPGVIVDEYGATWNTRPTGPVSALDQFGSPVWIDWVASGGSLTVDVTGTVSAGGLVTFVLIGLPDGETSVGSRESGLPPFLTVETIVYPGA